MIVKVQNTESATDEWCILEFQGEILGDLAGDLGQIEVTKSAAHMEIGQHTLEGDIVKLKNPFMVLEKVKSNDDKATLSMRGLVQNKIIFKTRPRPKRLVK